MMNKRTGIILFFWLWALSSGAQQVTVTASATKNKILLGEPFQLTLQATLPANQSVDWFRTDTFPHFEVLVRSKIDTQVNGAAQTLVQNIQLTSWDSGRWQLPSFALPGSNRTRPIRVDVVFTTPFDPKQDYHDVKDNLAVRRPARISWYWYVVGLVVLLVLYWLLFPGRKKKKDAVASDAGAYKEALQQLESLRKKANTVETKIFYTELILVLRNYLRKRKNIQSNSKTTEDIALHVHELGLSATDSNQLLQELRLSDLVKFARFEPSVADKQQSLKVVQHSISAMEKK